MYEEYQPGPHSQRLVECFWTVKGEPSGFQEVLPDGNMDIIYNFSGPLVNQRGERQTVNKAGIFVVGNLTKAVRSGSQGTYDLFGIRFKACGAGALLHDPLKQYTDTSVPWDDTERKNLLQPLERLHSISTAERIQLLDASLGRLEHRVDHRVKKALSIIEVSNGVISIGRLAREVCVSQKQLQRLFLHFVGVTPKIYADTTRFRALQKVMIQPLPKWEMAESLGFYDHAHLYKFIDRFMDKSQGES